VRLRHDDARAFTHLITHTSLTQKTRDAQDFNSAQKSDNERTKGTKRLVDMTKKLRNILLIDLIYILMSFIYILTGSFNKPWPVSARAPSSHFTTHSLTFPPRVAVGLADDHPPHA
jgi:hypothetical protein